MVLVADLRGAVGFGSFAVLTDYALANASDWLLSEENEAGHAGSPASESGCVSCSPSPFRQSRAAADRRCS